ncbi:MAG: SDR family oxidoreductase [Sphingorhabdus sp.]
MELKRVIVTGGASGIGRAIAECFLEANADVYVCDSDKAALADLPGINGAYCDVSDTASVKAFFAQVVQEFGGVDVLINNAGIGGPTKPLQDVDNAEWEQIVGVNVNGPFYCTRAAARLMIPQRKGAIINISSTSARTGMKNRTPYVATKSALAGLTLNTARELGAFNIRCNMILPGTIDNPRGRALTQANADRHGISFEAALEEELSFVSMRTMINMQEIGETAVFLASDAARHISGQHIGVCGNVEWEE